MPLHTHHFPPAHETSSALSPPSLLACGVCGHHALTEVTGPEFTQEPSHRFVCGICGAHRVL